MKMSSIMKYLVLGGFILVLDCPIAGAFIPVPPTPPDVPGDAGKAIEALFKGVDAAKTTFSFDYAIEKTGVKGKNILSFKNKKIADTDKEGAQKAPGQGKIKGNSFLKIDDGSINEEQYYNAYFTLFLNSDSSGNPKAKPTEFEALRDLKAKEFKQDIAISTYVTAKVMEDFLVTVETTLDRLEKCQNGLEENNCSFFGLEMEKVDTTTQKASDGGDEDNTAQIGVARNAYIVTTVQDRLLRIIEQLTALEAVFEASQKRQLLDSIDTSKEQSSAEDYINKTYRFSYNETYTHRAAKGTPALTFVDRLKNCGQNCPKVNEDKADIKVLEDTEVLAQLAPIDDAINKAIAIHNFKSMIHQYKSQYRQYLLQKKIHEDAKKLVKTSDKCVVDFLTRHTPDNNIGTAQQIWYNGSDYANSKARYDYAKRSGLSGQLIKEYDSISADIAVGSSANCRGFYETCPSGYTKDTANCCEDDGNLCSCTVALITEDAGDKFEEVSELPSDPLAVDTKKSDKLEETDGLQDSTVAEALNNGNRESLELTWNLGRKGIMKALKEHNLDFQPWNDQKLLEEEYLRNKYRNIGLIIKSTDIGMASFQVSSLKASKYHPDNSDPYSQYINAAARCKSSTAAISDARQKNCTGSYVSCDVKFEDGYVITDIVRRKITGYDDKGNPIRENVPDPEITEDQRVSLDGTCTYKKSASSINLDDICLTPQCMVQKYFPTKWTGGVTQLHDEIEATDSKKGRLVAMDKMTNVMAVRDAQAAIIRNFIEASKKEIASKENAVRVAIANLNGTNKAINDLREDKNAASTELNKTKKRIESINNEIADLDTRKSKFPGKDGEADVQAIEERIEFLRFEQKCLQTGINASKVTRNKDSEGNPIKKTCKDYEIALDSDYVTVKDFANKGYAYVSNPSKLEGIVTRLASRIDTQTSRLEELKKIVKDKEAALEEAQEKYAEEYLEKEESAQEAIEKANNEFERFLEKNENRMRNTAESECYEYADPLKIICKTKGPKRIKKDDLATTMNAFVNKGKDLKPGIKNNLNELFATNMSSITSVIPSSFVVDGTFAALDLSGTVSAAKLVSKIKDKVTEVASEDLKTIIEDADEAVTAAVNNAEEAVETFATNKKVSGESNAMPADSYLMSPANDHIGLIKTLRDYSAEFKEAGIDNLFGIPNSEITDNVDEEYFVALPARGNNYINRKAADKNAGRDFAAPKEMLSSVPPLREIFYYSGVEYDELSLGKNKDRPNLPELLNCKYYNKDKKECIEEYLPEVWLHILARPNLREDGKYKQTFVERSFGGNQQIDKLVTNQIANAGIFPEPKAADYRTIIGRSGVYPCKSKGKVIDMDGGDGVKNMKFKMRDSLLANVVPVDCQEAEISGTRVTHLLADKKAGKPNYNAENASQTSKPLYKKHSELGQWITEKLKYRPLMRNILKHLSEAEDEDGNENMSIDITRAKAESAAFKRNVMGSFLDAVKTEYNARADLQQSKLAMIDNLKSLCEQYNSLEFSDAKSKPRINGCESFNDTASLDEMADVEKVTVVDTMALAKSYDDNDYFEGAKKSKGDDIYLGISCSSQQSNIYTEIFCTLDAAKDQLVKEAQNKTNALKGKLKDTKGATYIKERLEKIDGYIGQNGSLIKDKDEITVIRPDVTPNIKEGTANRLVEVKTAEEGLEELANRNHAAAYCPIY